MPRSLLALLGAIVALAAPASCLAQLQASVLGADPPVGHGILRFPQALAFSPGGAFVWVADQRSSVVQEFSRDGTWVKDVGWRADDRETGRIGTVGGLAVDRAGHLYVLDSENDRVQVFRTDDGTWLGAWGSNGTTPGHFRLGDNTGAGGLGILQPTATDPVLAYVADQFNHRIQRFTLTGFLPPGARDPQNPNVVPAGKLIDELGLKGTRVGGAVISDVHGNFIVNEGGATAKDVLSLIEIIRQRARAARGIELETEVEIVGES